MLLLLRLEEFEVGLGVEQSGYLVQGYVNFQFQRVLEDRVLSADHAAQAVVFEKAGQKTVLAEGVAAEQRYRLYKQVQADRTLQLLLKDLPLHGLYEARVMAKAIALANVPLVQCPFLGSVN